MKKILPLFLLTTASAFAVTIGPDTKIKWNAIVVVAALHDVGLEGDSDFHSDVVLTYNRILDDLLARKTFSAADAVSVCMQQCNKSSFLKDGRGQSGKKCSDICKDFGMALVKENNKGLTTIRLGNGEAWEGPTYHPLGRIYSSDEKFYSLSTGEKTASMMCDDAIFESSTNKKIAVCEGGFGEGGLSEIRFKVIEPKYNGLDFKLGCKFCVTCENGDEGFCWLTYVDRIKKLKDLQQEYERCVNVYKSVDLATIKTLSANPLIGAFGLGDISRNAEKIFAQKNKFYSAKYDNFNEWELKKTLIDYCENINLASINAQIERGKSAIKCAKDNFKTTSRFKDTETKTLEDAKNEIVWYLNGKCKDVRWRAMMKCSGDCNGPGKQDFVTCTFGDMKATFEFDDICEGNWKQKAKSLFGK